MMTRKVRPTHSVVAIIRDGDKFLCIKRAADIIAGGQICFPGGGIDAGETEQEAVVREIREEVGLQIRPIKKVFESVTPWNVHVSWYTVEFLAGQIGQIEIDPAEVESYSWLTLEEFEQSPDILISNVQFLDAWKAGKIDLSDSRSD